MAKKSDANWLKRALILLAFKAAAALALTATGFVRMRRPLGVGATLPPDLTALDQDEKPLPLGELLQEPGWNAVFFFPRAGTSGCTRQVCNLRDGFADLRRAGVRVFGVSGDTPGAQRKFRDEMGLPYTLIADDQAVIARAFGISRVGPVGPRHTFLLRDGKIVFRQLNANPATQAEDLLTFVENA